MLHGQPELGPPYIACPDNAQHTPMPAENPAPRAGIAPEAVTTNTCIADTVSTPTAPNATPAGQAESGTLLSPEDFPKLFEDNWPSIRGFLYGLVSDPDVADDLTQDTFYRVYRALVTGAEVRRVTHTGWLYEIAKNAAYDALRRRRRIAWEQLPDSDDMSIGATRGGTQGAIGSTGLASAALAESPERQVELRRLVSAVLQRMPRQDSECLLLHEVQGFKCHEIAEQLRISTSTVKWRLIRARGLFMKLYDLAERGELEESASMPLQQPAASSASIEPASDGASNLTRKKLEARTAQVEAAAQAMAELFDLIIAE